MSLPVIQLTGPPFAQGLQHGRELRDRVARNMEVYFDRFLRETELPREQVLDIAQKYGNAIADQNPDYYDGMSGIAEGAGFTLDEIVALNVRYEILYYQFGKLASEGSGFPSTSLGAGGVQGSGTNVDGCTSFALAPGATEKGHLLHGQNWDWIPQVQGAVVHTVEGNGLRTLSFTEAGIFGGKIGFNSAGLGLTVNGMTSTDDDWSRLHKPFHVRCYEILRSTDLDDAVKIVTGDVRSCSTNFLISKTPGRAIDIEAAPKVCNTLSFEDGALVHTNHFLDPEQLGIVEPPSERRPFSCHRRERMTELLASKRPLEIDDLKEFLQDHVKHPMGICRHEDPNVGPEEHYITVTSVIMDTTAKAMWITDGPPCLSKYERVTM